jgi:hypothetical protein
MLERKGRVGPATACLSACASSTAASAYSATGAAALGVRKGDRGHGSLGGIAADSAR